GRPARHVTASRTRQRGTTSKRGVGPESFYGSTSVEQRRDFEGGKRQCVIIRLWLCQTGWPRKERSSLLTGSGPDHSGSPLPWICARRRFRLGRRLVFWPMPHENMYFKLREANTRAICIPPGTRLILQDIPQSLQCDLKIG